MRLSFLLLLLPIFLVIAGCDSDDDEDVWEGHYSLGFEVNSFEPCGMNEQWWVTGDSDDLVSRYQEVHDSDYQPVYAHLRGIRSEEGSYGHMGAYEREFEVQEVLEVRLAGDRDCD